MRHAAPGLGLLLGTLLGGPALAAEPTEVPTVHGLALYGDPALPADFTHFPHANPDAPTGGSLVRSAIGSFDSTNPFIIRGTPATGLTEIYDTLLTQNPDEPFSMYGLIAEGVRLDPERQWIEFDLHPEARFHDGEPVTAEDVVFSFETLTEKGQPFYGAYYADVVGIRAVDEDTVHFDLADSESRELPLIIGQLPILPAHFWQDRDFEATTRDALLGSGPYRIGEVAPGRRIVFERVDDYWGRELPVNRGRHNMERLVFDYYRDQTVALEAFKAGNLDMRIETSARNWATAYDFPALEEGFVERLEVPDGQPAGMQAYVMNLRRDKFQDVRVREALNLAFDFEWLNRNLFYGAYERTESYFANSEMAAEGLPSEAELALLEPHRETLPERVFEEPLPVEHPDEMRPRLARALELLNEAGYVVRDGVMTHLDSGAPLTVEVLLFDTQFERVVQPLLQNLAKIGIQGDIRIVDVNQYLNRLRGFDFDIIVGSFPQSANPGNEQRDFWTSEYAEVPQSRNLIGLSNPVVDELVDDLITADSREALDTAARALDRVLRWGFYVIPQWHLGKTRIALWDKFGWREPFPEYTLDLAAWWVDPERGAEIEARQRNR
ncbi:microcin C transport system substrate-binding protein [Halomonas ventosae]|uniref:Microcin C transport system substrate-binding protein n=1 Tax=Halomonas ventosae TaxID=229007 RepID=A0A4R6ZX72_9GAMM|nr:extracellular solute-binding protein [Halomonas ventosae]TDR57358.1 microcin C transport system substrate-binding protein [Halomonas ventosae]